LHFEILHPVTEFHVVVVLGSVFWLESVENSQRVLHVVVEVPADEVVEGFDSVVEDFHVVDGSENEGKVEDKLPTATKTATHFLAGFFFCGRKCSGM
jgi:hypothetical protein